MKATTRPITYQSLNHLYQVRGGQKRDGGYPVALSFRHSGAFPYQSTENDLGPIGGRRAKRLSSAPDDLFRYSAQCQQIHQRRFAGAVLADHGMNGAFVYRKRNILVRCDAGKSLAET